MTARGLLANRDARLYLIGQTLSLLGDSAMWLACGIWVKTLTGSSAAAGLTFLFFSLPTLLAPLSGLLVDRVRRRPLLVAANLAGALVVAPLLLVSDSGDVWLIYTVMLLYGWLNVLVAPAQSALLSTLLPTELRPSANAALRTAQEGLRIVAPLAGAGLFTLVGGQLVVLLDMVTFLAAAACTAALSLREPKPTRTAHDLTGGAVRPTKAGRLTAFGRDLGAGFHFLLANKTLRGVTIGTAVATLVIGFSDSANYAVVDGLRQVPEFLGVLQMVQGVGAIVGGLTATWVMRRFGEIKVAAAGVAFFALGPLFMTIAFLPAALAGKVLCGIGLPWMAIAILTLFQRVSPNHLQGRVFSALEVLTSAPHIMSIGVGAALIASFDYRLVLGAEGLVLLLSGWVLFGLARAGGALAPPPDEPGPAAPQPPPQATTATVVAVKDPA
ncbi:MFS transporter [Micromonospora parathelypteridis]|uniref:MFS family permease n=1 Tax=Micromonospora parathelypteridis TaxID=1839617 RepID=A0A840VXS9_9ACTN|nr:MFS transporter [Micromonospora parathelypteridis]MBB5480806.1 MFS family permease [Micromonospora parathelypteridis]GGO21524.1 MFS transporter [Micromonospora parathelypteridis]